MKLQLNGKPYSTDDNITVNLLIQGLKLDPLLVVIELNHRILAREEFSTVCLSDGDIIEIVQFVGGG